MVIDFNSRSRLDKPDLTANLEILGWDDPIMEGTPRDEHRVMIDGIVPLALAREIEALCARHNEALALSA